ncbi:unnamed protein product, partial [Didymodactylos carnosus]
MASAWSAMCSRKSAEAKSTADSSSDDDDKEAERPQVSGKRLFECEVEAISVVKNSVGIWVRDGKKLTPILSIDEEDEDEFEEQQISTEVAQRFFLRTKMGSNENPSLQRQSLQNRAVSLDKRPA